MIFRILTGTMLLFIGGLLGCGDKGEKRLPESGFQVAFESHKIASQMTSGKTISANIMVKNISPVAWPSKQGCERLLNAANVTSRHRQLLVQQWGSFSAAWKELTTGPNISIAVAGIRCASSLPHDLDFHPRLWQKHGRFKR